LVLLGGNNGGLATAPPFFKAVYEACRDGVVEVGREAMTETGLGAIERRGGGTVGGAVGGDEGLEAVENLRSILPFSLVGDTGVLRALGFFGTGGAGLRLMEGVDDIDSDRTEGGGGTERAIGEMSICWVGRLGGNFGADSLSPGGGRLRCGGLAETLEGLDGWSTLIQSGSSLGANGFGGRFGFGM
jgi:hypothetical protein